MYDQAVTAFSVFIGIAAFFFPIWVMVHAWRKGQKKIVIVLGVSFAVPLLPQIIAMAVFFAVKPYSPEWKASPVLRNYIGCGTGLYGKADKRGDGTYIATQWFILLYVPIFPIQSYRVVKGEEKTNFQGVVIESTVNYGIVEALKIDFKQVCRTYLGMVLIFVFLVLLVLHK